MGSCDYEAVSALVDGELNEQECEGVIRHLNECHECCRLFERFHATRNMVRGEGGATVPEDFCERVSAAIAEEEAHASASVTPLPVGGSAPEAGGRSPWAWVATAAGLGGVALVAGFLLQQTPAPDEPSSSPSLAQQSAQPAAASRTQQRPDPEDMAAIQRYLPEHSSFVPNGSGAEFQRTRLDVDKR